MINDNYYNYENLTTKQKDSFLNYKISLEIIKKIKNRSEEEFNSNIHDVFERLQNGKTLEILINYGIAKI